MRKLGCSCACIGINLVAAIAVVTLVRLIVDVSAPGKPPGKLRCSAPDRKLRPALLRGTGVDKTCLLHGHDKASTQHDFRNFYETHLDMKQIRSVLGRRDPTGADHGLHPRPEESAPGTCATTPSTPIKMT